MKRIFQIQRADYQLSNPAPLGLCAFGISTILLNIHNAGFFGMNAMILSIGIFYGGIGQIIAGIIESKKNNVFGFTAFTSFGFFWISLAATMIFPKLGIATEADSTAMGFYLSCWGFFTLFLFFATLKLNKGLQFIFGSLTILFFLLAASDFLNSESLKKWAGYEGILCGISAVYVAFAELLNEVYGKEILPLGGK